MDFASIKQKINTIDYSWNQPSTYAVFVPGLSLLVQKIKFNDLLPLQHQSKILGSKDINDKKLGDIESRKFINICKWHLRGSMFQVVASLALLNMYRKNNYLLVPAILATYEMMDTLLKGLNNRVTVCEFKPNGAIKYDSRSATNIF